MKRTIALVLASVATATVVGQNKGIPWIRDLEKGIALAKKTDRPLMFYVEGETRTTDDQRSYSDDIRKAFQNQQVLYATRNFVPVTVVRSRGDLKKFFENLRVGEGVTQQIVFATPAGERIDDFRAWDQPGSLAQKASLVFRGYRKQLFDAQIKPKLEDKKTTPTELKKALKQVEDFSIVEADQSLIGLLQNARLDAEAHKMALSALAECSTPAAVEFLLKQSVSPEKSAAAALAALEKCTPGAAKEMLKAFNGDDAPLKLSAYKAMVKICKIPNPKPDKFWEGKADKPLADEEARVRKEVEKNADRWQKNYGQYR